MTTSRRDTGIGLIPGFLQTCLEKGLLTASAAICSIDRLKRDEVPWQDTPTFSGVSPCDSSSDSADYAPLLLGRPPRPELIFDAFYPFEVNREALRACRFVAEQPTRGCSLSPLFCQGGAGMGKTHLLSAIANAARHHAPLLVSARDFAADVERAERLGRVAELRCWVRNHGMLLLDDVHLAGGREATQCEIEALLEDMIRQGSIVAISAAVPPAESQGFLSRLSSRVMGGMTVQLAMGSREERVGLVHHWLGGETLPRDVVEYLVQHAGSSVRQLRAATVQLLMLCASAPRGPSIELARAVAPLAQDLGVEPEQQSLVSPIRETSKTNAPAVARFRNMLASAESREEQILALQIALSEKLRQLRERAAPTEETDPIRQALGQLRDGKLENAVKGLEEGGGRSFRSEPHSSYSPSPYPTKGIT